MKKTFGEKIQAYRRGKGWTVKQFIEKLGNDLSPSYVTKIEVHGEIPSPELICKIADVFGIKEQELLEDAKEIKVQQFEDGLSKKYQRAVGLYRLQRRKKGDG
jgi:transcriptional regulator with XRE-family HTH domain